MMNNALGITGMATVARCKPIITTTAVSYPVMVCFPQNLSDEYLEKLWRFCNENLILGIDNTDGCANGQT